MMKTKPTQFFLFFFIHILVLVLILPLQTFAAGGGGGDCINGTTLTCGDTVSTPTGYCIGCNPTNADNGGICCWSGADFNCDGTQDVENSVEDFNVFSYTVPAGITCGTNYIISVTTVDNIQGAVYNITQGGGINYGHSTTDTYTSTYMGGGSFTLTTNACEGDSLRIFIDGYAGDVGSFDIVISCATPCTPATLSISEINPACGACNGIIDLTVNGGTSPYSYLWNNGTTTQDIISLCTGTYTVTVTSTGGCTSSQSISLINTNGPTISALVTNSTCVADGFINLTVSGGTAPYSYYWSTGDTTKDVFSLKAGLYRVTVTDADSCGAIASATVVDDGTPTVFFQSITGSPCEGDASGAINMSISGGATPYTFLWSNSATTQNISSLTAGIYTVTVTSANSCTGTASLTLPLYGPSNITSIVTSPCNAQSNGTINITVTGGIGALTISWSTGSNLEDISDLSAGIYTVTVTDGKSCSLSSSVSVTTSAFTVNAGDDIFICSSTDSVVLGGAFSGAQFNDTDTTYTLVILWSPSSDLSATDVINPVFSNPGPGTYTYTLSVTDAVCTLTDEVVITIDSTGFTYYADTDGDTYGNATDTTFDCSTPLGYVSDSTDCDDSNSDINPGATEIVDGVDNNCDGNIDEVSIHEEILQLANSIEGYPVPVTDNVNFKLNTNISDNNLTLKVKDVLGRLVLSKSISANKKGDIIGLDVKDLNQGLYQVIFTGDNFKASTRLIISR